MNMYAFRSIRRCFHGIFLNKYQVSVIFILIFIVLCFSHLGEILSHVMNDSKSDIPYCGEPIDVVYTWVNGSDPHFRDALKHYLNKANYKFKDSSDERFDDKYELKFSLRSLEKYAPWVRHVYIVTNGQIPYWLNLDYEKVSIVTHEDIFVDETHIPTFSSPAIESNIHRISGLSNKFIYFNDDIFLGAPTYPEDFVSPNRGYLIYQAWPLPSCSLNCPWTYVGDGQCDTSCYNFVCQFDGGDCGKDYDGSKVNSHHVLYGNGEDDSEELKNPIDYEYYDDERKNNVVKRNTLHNETAQITAENINKTKGISMVNDTRGLSNLQWNRSVVEQTSVIKKILNNNTHISDIVSEHNRKVILSQKLYRRKRLLGPLSKRKRHYKRMFNVSQDNIMNNSNLTENGDTERTERELDTYALSLQNTNRVFNLAYGYKSRKVPAHSPILVDKNIMDNLQRKFRKEFEVTRRNKFRSANDMQYSFSYYYYLINEKRVVNISDIFDMFDTDNSSTWSDREIRTVLTKINDLPLSYRMVEMFDSTIINCSKTFRGSQVTVPLYERYIDSKLPTVSKQLVEHCPDLVRLLTKYFGITKKYQYEIVKNAQSQHVMFKMLTSNISDVVGHLDEIRKESRKFVCLNDNMDPRKIEENELVKAVLLDFYLSLFPKPSLFELPQEYRNRFTYVKDLLEWRQHHMKLKVFLLVCVVSLCSISFYNICKRRLLRQIKRIIYL